MHNIDSRLTKHSYIQKNMCFVDSTAILQKLHKQGLLKEHRQILPKNHYPYQPSKLDYLQNSR